ncbi:MAG: phosphate acyltransferase [Chloroflexia bacterium]|jgi:glycerol-3-phosphate acyltransferase PlsX|nr:phosphate acyltransferase [Chloroflexia bacterium]
MKIALDAMGGDYAPVETVKGAILAAREYGIEVALVGQEAAIKAELAKEDTSGLKLTIEPAASVIPMDEHQPSTAWRRQRDSSLTVGLQLLADRKVDALVSAGNTGAVVSGGTFVLRRIEGIDRPALGVPFPAMGNIGKIFLIDVGATPDAKPHYLLQWARLASIYMERVYDVKNPRVGLVSNGEEETKGSELVRDTFPLLQNSGLNFVGNVEGKDVPAGVADVVVTDGFTGNVIIKTTEGVAKMIFDLLRSELTSSVVSKLFAAGLRSNFRRIGDRLDYAEYGGSIVMGVDGLLIKPHGRSNAKAIKNAIRVAKSAVEQDVMNIFRQVGEAEGVGVAGR